MAVAFLTGAVAERGAGVARSYIAQAQASVNGIGAYGIEGMGAYGIEGLRGANYDNGSANMAGTMFEADNF